jgi:hypothetical protein
MTKSMKIDYPSIADILALNGRFVLNNQGIDSIQQIAKYETVKKMADTLGLVVQEVSQSHKLYEKIAVEMEADTTKRLKSDKFSPMVEIIKLPKVKPKDKDLYISIIRNTPTLFDVATKRKTKKDSYCMVTFAGLHQPTKKISSEAMQVISSFLKRKTFKVCRVDIAIDTYDHRPINKEAVKGFKSALMPFSKHGVKLEKTSLYINNTGRNGMSKIIFYDKYTKQLEQQKKEIITDNLKGWKRLEITLTFDVTKHESKGFIDYIEGFNFLDDLYDVADVARLAGIKEYSNDYLTYQLNSLIDNRFMNNHESKEQFNSVESLERFKLSDFRRYLLPI